MKKLILCSVFLLVNVLLFAQSMREQCGTTTYQEALYDKYPDLRQVVEANHQKALEAIRQPAFKSGSVVHTIPVVVHIVYENEDENISDEQVLSQLEVLNADFRKMNADVSMVPEVFEDLVADVEIEFCLATIDPNGNFTTGITRTATNIEEFGGINNDIKIDAEGGKSPWDATRYLNIWVCDIEDSILGFATSPGTTPAFDGIVIDYDNFGTIEEAVYPYNRGRTTTHEVGHYLGLRHIWGDGDCSIDDGISDTPLQEMSHTGCPSFGSPSNTTCGSQDMFMNYMDYVDDRCMFMFTLEQAEVMRFNLEYERSGLLQSVSVACDPTGGEGCNDLTNALKMGFEDDEDVAKWKVVNTNNDSKEWGVSEGLNGETGPRTGEKCMAYTWSVTNDADDWFFSPCFEVKSGKNYKLSFWYATSEGYTEKMKVGFSTSTSPDDMLEVPIDFGEVSQPYNSDEAGHNYKEAVVTIPNVGNTDIHVGFQCYSDVEQHSLLIDDILIEMLVSTDNTLPDDTTFDIYPNPVTNRLMIDLDFDKNIELIQISLVDITGRTLDQKRFENYSTGKLQFDLNDYANGVYFIHIKADERIANRKIIVSN